MQFCNLPIMLAVLCAVAPPLVHAERATDIQALTKESRILAYITDEEATKILGELGRKWDKKLGIACDQEYRVKIHPALILVLRPIELPIESKHPIDGTWQYRFELTRCGSAKIYNAIVAANKDAPPRYGELLPGKTLASPVLMRDALPTVYMKVTLEAKMKEKKECDDFAVKDTILTVMPQISREGSSISISSRYEEAWIVRYCGTDISIPICFTPKPDGGSSFLTQPCKEAG